MPHNACYYTANDRDSGRKFYRYCRQASDANEGSFISAVLAALGVSSSNNSVNFGRRDNEPSGSNWEEI
ncbi:hypothetical protein [Phascolarctobacterium faecium]|uniref:hypothetical protein n=1 Tax=Phascolarctobacterium faecium TaxID=33025 RepID=UPI00265F1AAC|nr:hypothetical protein [Phascolarctobacterium faecium]